GQLKPCELTPKFQLPRTDANQLPNRDTTNLSDLELVLKSLKICRESRLRFGFEMLDNNIDFINPRPWHHCNYLRATFLHIDNHNVFSFSADDARQSIDERASNFLEFIWLHIEDERNRYHVPLFGEIRQILSVPR